MSVNVEMDKRIGVERLFKMVQAENAKKRWPEASV